MYFVFTSASIIYQETTDFLSLKSRKWMVDSNDDCISCSNYSDVEQEVNSGRQFLTADYLKFEHLLIESF